MEPQRNQLAIDMLAVGQRIRELRKARGFSMAIADQLRARYGIRLDRSYLSRLERGQAEIPLRTLLAIADFLEIDPADLVRPTALRSESDRFLGHPVIKEQLKLLSPLIGDQQLLRAIESYLNVLWQVSRDRPESATAKIRS